MTHRVARSAPRGASRSAPTERTPHRPADHPTSAHTHQSRNAGPARFAVRYHAGPPTINTAACGRRRAPKHLRHHEPDRPQRWITTAAGTAPRRPHGHRDDQSRPDRGRCDIGPLPRPTTKATTTTCPRRTPRGARSPPAARRTRRTAQRPAEPPSTRPMLGRGTGHSRTALDTTSTPTRHRRSPHAAQAGTPRHASTAPARCHVPQPPAAC